MLKIQAPGNRKANEQESCDPEEKEEDFAVEEVAGEDRVVVGQLIDI